LEISSKLDLNIQLHFPLVEYSLDQYFCFLITLILKKIDNKIPYGICFDIIEFPRYNGCMERIHREFAHFPCSSVYDKKSVTRAIAITTNTLAVSITDWAFG
ncbi:hypothetical protein ACT4UT_35075, partial [Bacillus sp. B-TM1]